MKPKQATPIINATDMEYLNAQVSSLITITLLTLSIISPKTIAQRPLEMTMNSRNLQTQSKQKIRVATQKKSEKRIATRHRILSTITFALFLSLVIAIGTQTHQHLTTEKNLPPQHPNPILSQKPSLNKQKSPSHEKSISPIPLQEENNRSDHPNHNRSEHEINHSSLYNDDTPTHSQSLSLSTMCSESSLDLDSVKEPEDKKILKKLPLIKYNTIQQNYNDDNITMRSSSSNSSSGYMAGEGDLSDYEQECQKAEEVGEEEKLDWNDLVVTIKEEDYYL